MITNKFKVGQLVQVKVGTSWTFEGSPAIIIGISTQGFYQCAVAGGSRVNPVASSSGWNLDESELTEFVGLAKAGRSTLRKPRTSLTPSAAAIAAHLKREGNISGVEAAAMFKTRQLPGRISELRSAGYDIASNFDHDTSPTKQRYVRYHLVKAPELLAA